MQYKLALKIAVASAFLLALIGIPVMGLIDPTRSSTTLLFFAGLSVPIVYALTYLLVTRRLRMARTILTQIQDHQFYPEQVSPSGYLKDELNDLLLQVRGTNEAVQRDLEILRKNEHYRREYLGNVSHELKTPIFAVKGFAETLLDGALEDKRVNRAFVEKIMHHGQRLDNLVNDLTEISRIESGALTMAISPFDLANLLDEVVNVLELSATKQQITLVHQTNDHLPRALGDRERIAQVLTNLVDNAIKYTEPGGRINVIARPLPNHEIKVEIHDTGIGIAPEHIDRLTERFYRVDKSRSRKIGGTGLGLAIVKHILEAHGQTLTIESQPGVGSTLSFTLATAETQA